MEESRDRGDERERLIYMEHDDLDPAIGAELSWSWSWEKTEKREERREKTSGILLPPFAISIPLPSLTLPKTPIRPL